MFFGGQNEYYKDIENDIIKTSLQEEQDEVKDTSSINSNNSDTSSSAIQKTPHTVQYYIKNLNNKMIFRFVTYGSTKYKKIYTRGLDIFKNGEITLTQYDNLKCRFKFNVKTPQNKQHKCEIKFSHKCINEERGMISGRDIIDCACSCEYKYVCKHICASLLTIKDEDYQVKPILPYYPYRVMIYIFLY